MIVRLSTLMLILLASPSIGWTATYYAGPSGSGTACSFGSPCTVATLLTTVQPGDTGILKSGTYTGATQMLSWSGTWVSGHTCSAYKGGTSESARITIKAEVDGLAIVDGQSVREPMKVICIRYVDFEGLRIQNSNKTVVLAQTVTQVNWRRVSAYNGYYYPYPDPTACPGVPYYNHHVMEIIGKSTYTLVEDSIFGGSGRNLYNTFGASHHNIIRRSILAGGGYTRGTSINGCTSFPNGSNHGEPLQVYGSSDNVVENVIAFGVNTWSGHLRFNQAGMIIWVNLGEAAHRNKMLGSVVINYPNYGFGVASKCNITNASACLTNSVLENIVTYKVGRGVHLTSGQNTQVNYVTAYGAADNVASFLPSGLFLEEKNDDPKLSYYSVKNLLSARNTYGCRTLSTLSPGDVTLTYGMFFSNATADFDALCNQINKTNITTGVNPALNSIAYIKPGSPALTAGEGGGRVGADTRCRYVSAFSGANIVTTHTNESLWPLPDSLNERVKTETLQVMGIAHDPNAIVLDALAPRVPAELPCPNGEAPLDPATFVSATGTTSVSFGHNLPDGTDQALVCVALYDDGQNVGQVSSVTIGGEALTLLAGGRRVTSPAFRAVEIWGRANPLTEVQPVVVNTTGAVDGIAVTSMALDPWPSTGTVISSTGLGTAVQSTVATTATDTVVDCLSMSSSPTATAGANQAFETSTSHPAQEIKLTTSLQNGVNGGAMSWTLSSDSYFAHMAVSSAGGTPTASTFRVTKWKASSVHGSMVTPEVPMGEHGVGGVGVEIAKGGSLRVRTEIKVETLPSVETGVQLYCRKNADPYMKIMETFGGAAVKLIGNIPSQTIPSPGTPTTQQISSGTYTPHTVVRLESQAVALPAIPTNNLTETEWILDTDPALANEDTIACEVRDSAGVAIGLHNVTPTFTIREPSASIGS